ncbi:MAG: thiol-disulfide oxidoreductase DCC family protein [Verrucomicrobiota bacterium]
MNTEIADKREGCGGRVCYDRDCPVCRKWAGRFTGVLERNGFAVVPLQAPEIRAYLRLPEAELLQEMRVITADGKVIGGANALVFLAAKIPALRPFNWLAKLPGVSALLCAAYRWFARNRTCDGEVCRLPSVEKVLRRKG